MSDIKKKAQVGNVDQNADCVIVIEPSEGGNQIFLESLVKTQYGDAIIASAEDELKKYNVTNAKLTITDRGTIDCVLRARLEAVIKRGMEA
ncbi:MAG: citrate lyase acyl carrier protein [Firmicutes bacterium]|nr:citrate lyase acyl carrier protein [Bacillota bacterium]MBR0114621.1 citrate lyase acyl carrier protein [Bacillota bacterium]MBR0441161.1 citrate lyase acyl carrier protein [Bacillota bacterium]MBR0522211.1 citrate lyase acyl carrier protein [Bacillota bacterium]